ncbi:hypothetical protein [Verrucomicrobium spinosum]|uniref:hypothetical protein n=1 Tax=Verrucomicrobium spinosum TaxID=2736 RepID=UPI0009465EAA|nr:hypothetical protein [Verrucomicrobium spinosum]
MADADKEINIRITSTADTAPIQEAAKAVEEVAASADALSEEEKQFFGPEFLARMKEAEEAAKEVSTAVEAVGTSMGDSLAEFVGPLSSEMPALAEATESVEEAAGGLGDTMAGALGSIVNGGSEAVESLKGITKGGTDANEILGTMNLDLLTVFQAAWDVGTLLGKTLFNTPDWEQLQKDTDAAAASFAKVRDAVSALHKQTEEHNEALRQQDALYDRITKKLERVGQLRDQEAARRNELADAAADRQRAEIEAGGGTEEEKLRKTQELEKRERARKQQEALDNYARDESEQIRKGRATQAEIREQEETIANAKRREEAARQRPALANEVGEAGRERLAAAEAYRDNPNSQEALDALDAATEKFREAKQRLDEFDKAYPKLEGWAEEAAKGQQAIQDATTRIKQLEEEFKKQLDEVDAIRRDRETAEKKFDITEAPRTSGTARL